MAPQIVPTVISRMAHPSRSVAARRDVTVVMAPSRHRTCGTSGWGGAAFASDCEAVEDWGAGQD